MLLLLRLAQREDDVDLICCPQALWRCCYQHDPSIPWAIFVHSRMCFASQYHKQATRLRHRDNIWPIVRQSELQELISLRGSDCSVSFLTSSVPDLCFDGLIVNLNATCGKFDTNGRLGLKILHNSLEIDWTEILWTAYEFVSRESAKEVGLSYSAWCVLALVSCVDHVIFAYLSPIRTTLNKKSY